MIDSLHLKNFKSHNDTFIELSPGINVFIGTSGHGKSNIIRALKWIIKNKPAGDSVRSWNDKNTKVTIVKNKQIISREKGTNGNSYQINKEKFTGFGQKVPEEVQQALNLSDINFQGQHDPYFLIDSSISPGEVAKYLNKIANLSQIDSTIAHANKRVKDNTHKLGYQQEELEEHQKESKQYEWIEEAQNQLTSLEQLDNEVRKMDREEIRLILFIQEISTLKKEIEKRALLLPILNEIDLIDRFDQEIEVLYEKEEKIKDLLRRTSQIDFELSELNQFTGLEKEVNLLIDSVKIIKERVSTETSLQKFISEVDRLKISVKEETQNVKTGKHKLNKACENECPLCGK